MSALIVIAIVVGSILAYAQIGFLIGSWVERKSITSDPEFMGPVCAVFWPVAAPALAAFFLFQWEHRLLTEGRRKKAAKPKRAKRHHLIFKHKLPDQELIAQMEQDLGIVEEEEEPREQPIEDRPINTASVIRYGVHYNKYSR